MIELVLPYTAGGQRRDKNFKKMVTLADDTTLLSFPCRYVLKITAIAAEITLEALLAIIKPHVPSITPADVAVKNSSQGKHALTC